MVVTSLRHICVTYNGIQFPIIAHLIIYLLLLLWIILKCILGTPSAHYSASYFEFVPVF